METSVDKHWATQYLLDPLHDMEPSQETGPGSHFSSTLTPTSPTKKRQSGTGASMASRAGSASSKKQPSSTVTSLPTPPASASPTQSTFHESNPFSPNYRGSVAGSLSPASPTSRHSRHASEAGRVSSSAHRRQSSSPLPARFPGDETMRPLRQLRRETKHAQRSPRQRHSYVPGADVIDSLDQSLFGMTFHHEGPYDATLLARNLDPKTSPVAATQSTNMEALKATPREHLVDSLTKHVPLQGTAVVPPGERGIGGQVMDYKEGADLQREADAPGGAYKRWPGMQYHHEDFKGKGEPSFTIERALKEDKHRQKQAEQKHRRIFSDGQVAYEMQSRRPTAQGNLRPGTTRQRSSSGNDVTARSSPTSTSSSTSSARHGSAMSYAAFESDLHRRHSTGLGFAAGLKKRLSLGARREARV